MIIFPAIDMRHGKCVRLLQGRAEAETVYFDDPVSVARRWEDEGACWLHLVDLDGAMSKGEENRAIARKIFKALKIPVQFGGGVRAMSDLQEILESGACRVILGTAAVKHPEFLKEAVARFSDKVIIGLDARDGFVATQGWNEIERVAALDFAKSLAARSVQRVIYTDISKDGMLSGPNLTATKRLAEESRLKVIASGGVSSIEDITHLKQLGIYGVEGVIVGKALYERKFSLKQAIEAAAS